jgi:hypothetical protein
VDAPLLDFEVDLVVGDDTGESLCDSLEVDGCAHLSSMFMTAPLKQPGFSEEFSAGRRILPS